MHPQRPTSPDRYLNAVLNRIRNRRWLAGKVLTFERLSLSFWALFFWFCGFAGLWLLGWTQVLPPEIRIVLSLVFFGGFLVLVFTGVHRFHLPTPREIDRRLEAASHLKNRPLTLLEDSPANDSSAHTKALWGEARARALKSLTRLKAPFPRALIAALDPKAFRLLALLLLIAGASVAGTDWQERLKEGLFPAKLAFPQGLPKTISLTITPPAYTGLAQSLIYGPGWAHTPIKIPVGSNIKATAQTLFGTPSLFMGDSAYSFKAQGQGNYTIEATLIQGGALGVSRLGFPVMRLPVEIIPDTPPSIKIDNPEELKDPKAYTVLPDNTLRFALNVHDDYGAKELHMEMKLDPVVEDPPLGEPITDIRAISSPPGKDQRQSPVYDFTASPWAGLPVQISFSVTDYAGQSGTMPPLSLTLPEREFRHPIAKALIALRKSLIWAPTAKPDTIVSALETLLTKPGAFQNDPIAYLGIKVASARLKYAYKAQENLMPESRSVVNLLWDTALRIEDGNLSLAARNLRDAQRELEKALRDGTMSKEQMMQLTDKVGQLLQQYLSELQKELQKRMADGQELPFMPPEMMNRSIDQEKLQGFMQQMLEEMQNGNPEKAQEMLSQLQRLLDSMNPSLTMPMPPGMQKMEQGISDMQQLIDRQEELLAQTRLQAKTLQAPQEAFRRLQEILPMENLNIEPDVSTPSVNTQANKTEQEALRYVLGQLMRQAGEIFKDIPPNLGMAEMEMRDSSEQLGNNRPDQSVPHQEETLKHLKEAQQQMQKELGDKMQQMMAGTGAPFFFLPQFGNRQLDPLGRPFSDDRNGTPNSLYAPVEIPDEAERRRAQEIQKLLRDRSGELYRPQEELDYFHRLLKQF
ncbi:MAG: DUF4175 domain-containing protein [Alphaproteobacteria bacterium]|nr:DUF4175 domain-containing protein [Alphaproteobacteria bacterium]